MTMVSTTMTSINQESFTAEERELVSTLDPSRLPQHIAVIMDGNGRWATRQGFPRVIGHRAGVESVRRTVDACLKLGVRYLTLYSFSRENWSRPAEEVHALMSLITEQLLAEAEALHEQGVRIRHLGRVADISESLLAALHEAQTLTRDNARMTLQFAINYSGRAELVDAARHLATRACAGEINPATIDEEDFAGALNNPDVPNPDLLLRTGGEMRVSNFLLWQIAYSEIWVTEDLWPEFTARHLLQAIENYQHRQRKFGGIGT